jgi:hypothetical protein
LLDHVPDVVIVVGDGGATALIEVNWIVDIHSLQVPVTRVCVTVIKSGVPVGTQSA